MKKGLQLYQKRYSDKGVFCEYCEIYKNTFTGHLQATGSANIPNIFIDWMLNIFTSNFTTIHEVIFFSCIYISIVFTF